MKIIFQVAAGILLAAIVIGAARLVFVYAAVKVATDQIKQMTTSIPAIVRASIPAPQAKTPPTVVGYRQIWVEGRELKECMGNANELNEAVMKCRDGYYRQVPVWSDGVIGDRAGR